MKTTGEGDAAPEPHKEPLTPNETPSPVKSNMNKTKRLLPIELRKRRQAAKLQALVEKKARVSLNSPPTFVTPTRPTLTLKVDTRERNALNDQESVQEKEKATDVEALTVIVPNSSSLARAEKKLPLATAIDTATRLNSLYASSRLGPHRRKAIPGANVPHIFHIPDLPLDIVPKIKLSVLTAYPYPFARVNSQIKKQALQQFVAGRGIGIQSTSLCNAMRWQEALHYFVHPAESVPSFMLVNRATRANTSEQLFERPKGECKRTENDYFTTRWNTWQESFRDIYMNFRRQRGAKTPDASFYLCSHDFVVYFQYEVESGKAATTTEDISSVINLCRQHDTEAEVSEREVESKHIKKRRLRAVMSQSNGRTRKALHHLNVTYTMPYINARQTQREVGEFHMLAEELEANPSRNRDSARDTALAPIDRATSVPENMHGADSLLLFSGHDAVHGLYEFLINRAPMSNQDVPQLYALHPFANASIQSLQVTSFGRVGGAPTALLKGDHQSQSTTLFRTEIAGFCFASSAVRLLAILKDEWETMKISHNVLASSKAEESAIGTQKPQIALRAYMEAVPGTERLNAVKLDERVTKSDDQDDHEKRRQQELEYSKRRLETVVVMKMESRYNVETTTRPTVVWR